jgi:hypothetical protein
MSFKPGQSGNPGGRKRTLGLSRAVRKSEGLKTWAMLLDIRDKKIREHKIEIENGEPVVVDVVPSVKERREAIKLILAYCWGTPVAAGQDEIERRLSALESRFAQPAAGMQ